MQPPNVLAGRRGGPGWRRRSSSSVSRSSPPSEKSPPSVEALVEARGPPPFAPHFEDVTPDFRSLFPRQFAREDEAEFEGFPLSRVHPASLISNIATFTSDTDLVDSECSAPL